MFSCEYDTLHDLQLSWGRKYVYVIERLDVISSYLFIPPPTHTHTHLST